MPDWYILTGPDGRTVNLGSYVRADPGPDFGSKDLLKAVFAENSFVEGGQLAYETVGVRRVGRAARGLDDPERVDHRRHAWLGGAGCAADDSVRVRVRNMGVRLPRLVVCGARLVSGVDRGDGAVVGDHWFVDRGCVRAG